MADGDRMGKHAVATDCCCCGTLRSFVRIGHVGRTGGLGEFESSCAGAILHAVDSEDLVASSCGDGDLDPA